MVIQNLIFEPLEDEPEQIVVKTEPTTVVAQAESEAESESQTEAEAEADIRDSEKEENVEKEIKTAAIVESGDESDDENSESDGSAEESSEYSDSSDESLSESDVSVSPPPSPTHNELELIITSALEDGRESAIRSALASRASERVEIELKKVKLILFLFQVALQNLRIKFRLVWSSLYCFFSGDIFQLFAVLFILRVKNRTGRALLAYFVMFSNYRPPKAHYSFYVRFNFHFCFK